jgi:hypothetical protein
VATRWQSRGTTRRRRRCWGSRPLGHGG